MSLAGRGWFTVLALLFACVAAVGACAGDRSEPAAFAVRLLQMDGLRPGVAYGPHRDGQRPGGPSPSREQLREDLRLIAKRWPLIGITFEPRAKSRAVSLTSAPAWRRTDNPINRSKPIKRRSPSIKSRSRPIRTTLRRSAVWPSSSGASAIWFIAKEISMTC